MFERSTLKGFALLGSVIAAATGYGHLFSVELTDTGVNFGGAVGLAIPAVIGAYEALPDKWKPSKKVGAWMESALVNALSGLGFSSESLVLFALMGMNLKYQIAINKQLTQGLQEVRESVLVLTATRNNES